MTARHSVRRYADTPVPAAIRDELIAEAARCNADSGLNIHVQFDEPAGFSGLLPHYGSFRGVRNYLALIGHTGTPLDTPAGYYGERLVLLAQHLGLNSCWAGLTYNKRQVRTLLAADEQLALVVALGYGESQGKPHKSKPIDKLGRTRDGGPWPDWFRAGVEAAALAPTAINQQTFSFELVGDEVHAHRGRGSYAAVDLGIVSYHFEIGADNADWRWANPLGTSNETV